MRPLSLPTLHLSFCSVSLLGLFANMFSFMLLRFFSLLILIVHTAAADDSNFYTAADSSPIFGLDEASSNQIPTEATIPYEKLSDLQLGEPLFLIDQNSRCSRARSTTRWHTRRNKGDASVKNPSAVVIHSIMNRGAQLLPRS